MALAGYTHVDWHSVEEQMGNCTFDLANWPRRVVPHSRTGDEMHPRSPVGTRDPEVNRTSYASTEFIDRLNSCHFSADNATDKCIILNFRINPSKGGKIFISLGNDYLLMLRSASCYGSERFYLL